MMKNIKSKNYLINKMNINVKDLNSKIELKI